MACRVRSAAPPAHPPTQRPPPGCHCQGDPGSRRPLPGLVRVWQDRWQYSVSGDGAQRVLTLSPLGTGCAEGGCGALGCGAQGTARGRGGGRAPCVPRVPPGLSAAVQPEEGAQRAGVPAVAPLCLLWASTGLGAGGPQQWLEGPLRLGPRLRRGDG